MSSRGYWGAIVVLAAASASARAAPPEADDERAEVLPPGLEQPLTDLMPASGSNSELSWRGPSIEVDRITWWLIDGDDPRATLVLAPRRLANPWEPVSRSFVVRVAWPDGREGPPEVRAAVDAAIATIQERDAGGFYVDAGAAPRDEPEPEPAPEPQSQPGPEPQPEPNPLLLEPAGDNPATLRRRWALELSGVAALGLFALVVTLRRDPPRPPA